MCDGLETRTNRRRRRGAFTLAELLIAVAILSLVLLLLTSLLSAINRAWTRGEQQVAEFQDGRAVIEIVSRELSQATISPNLQFVQNPSLPQGVNQRRNCDSIFWQAPSASTSKGNLGEIGYYLSDAFELKRFFVPPDNSKYAIFTSRPTDMSAPWLTASFNNTEFDAASSVVASGVLGFWVRCFDGNGDAIPWLSTNAPGTAPLKFNSAGHFQPAIPGQTTSFKYTNPSNTAAANLLPVTVELTVVTLDAKTFSRNPVIPGMPQDPADPSSPAVNGPNDIPAAISYFNNKLLNNTIRNAHTFTTRVELLNSAQR
jgi:prepilin-type N-terminal cleavage/methylation domain-containing protein